MKNRVEQYVSEVEVESVRVQNFECLQVVGLHGDERRRDQNQKRVLQLLLLLTELRISLSQ